MSPIISRFIYRYAVFGDFELNLGDQSLHVYKILMKCDPKISTIHVSSHFDHLEACI